MDGAGGRGPDPGHGRPDPSDGPEGTGDGATPGGESSRRASSDAGLQPERTALAWRRLGLALVAGGLLATHLVGAGRLGWGAATGGAAAVAAVVLLLLSHRDLVHRDGLAAERSPFVQLMVASSAVALLAAAGLALALR
jgi:putative membrane protein